MIKLHTIDTGFFKLDGGAMFGVVPKKMWKKLNPPDEDNMCTWAMRCMVVETADRKILIDTGFGDKQSEKFRSYFSPHGTATLKNSLAAKGFQPEDITDVFLTHLHFDHCGGAVEYDAQGRLQPAFPNATYWSNELHYNWALDPNPRERASFLKENFKPLKEAGVLQFFDVQENLEWFPGFNIRFSYGHTEAMMIPHINTGDKTVIFCADLMPSTCHIGMPYVMGYDIRPLKTLEEKHELYERILNSNSHIFFEHDKDVECASLIKNEKGRVVIKDTFDLH